MGIVLGILLGIIGYSLIEKYQYKVGGWINGYFIYVGLMLTLIIIYHFLIEKII